MTGGAPRELRGPKLRTLLAVLLVDANEQVSGDRLAAAMWPPATRLGSLANALQTQISRLRQIVDTDGDAGQSRLVRTPGGYCLHVDEDELDAFVFDSLFRRSRAAMAAGDWQTVDEHARAALNCWRGRALGEFDDRDFAMARAAQLEEHRLLAIECQMDAGLALGRHRALVAELEELVVEHPLRESLWCQLMVALYRSGRQTEALRAYERVRRILAEDLGVLPSRELARLQQAVLDQDRTLDWHSPGAAASQESARRSDVSDDSAGHRARQTEVSRNLPSPSTSFVGRAAEREQVAETLRDSRLVTLTGVGGCGKSRLALAVADDMIDRYAGGIRFVDLATLTQAEVVTRAIAAPLGAEIEELDQLSQACQQIVDDLLLILDNCEHLVEAVAKVVDTILQHCPSVTVLATSREELDISGEHVWRVPPLSLPDVRDVETKPASYLDSEAVQLFLKRGELALPGFAPDGESLRAVAQICRRLDGIPLAIELAAALVGSLPLAAMVERIDDRFQLLEGGRRGGPGRHQTLRATLDWSFALLDEQARDLFMRLGVFLGDFTLEAAEAVAGDELDSLAVARGLGHLVRTSMVTCVAGPGGADRYRMLETVRAYAVERLERQESAAEIRWRHARYYVDMAALAERHVHGLNAAEWLERLLKELPNLRAAMAWCIAQDDPELGLRLAGSLSWYFGRLGLRSEVARWLEVWLERRAELSPELRLQMLTSACTMGFMVGQFHRTYELGHEAIAIARELGHLQQLAVILYAHGNTMVYEGDVDRADKCLEEAEELCIRLGDRWGLGWTLTGRAVASRRRGELEQACDQLEQALRLFDTVHDPHGAVMPMIQMAIVAQDAGKADEALRWAEEAASLATEIQDGSYQRAAWCVLGQIEGALGNTARARALLLRSLQEFPGLYHWLMVAMALEGLAMLADFAGQHADAVALLGFTEAVRNRWLVVDARRREREQRLDHARSLIGSAQVEAQLRRGRELRLEDAIDIAESATSTFAV